MPIHSKQWVLNGSGSLDSLECQTVSIPALGQYDVLVKLKAVSLNYRDLAMALVRLQPSSTDHRCTHIHNEHLTATNCTRRI